MKKQLARVVVLFLVCAMLAGMMPVSALAATRQATLYGEDGPVTETPDDSVGEDPTPPGDDEEDETPPGEDPAEEPPAEEPVEEPPAEEPEPVAEVEAEESVTAAAVNMNPDLDWYGNGSAAEFEIRTAGQLAGLAALVNGTADDGTGGTLPAVSFAGKTISLMNNITLAGNWTPIGRYDTPFSGTFQGYDYENMTISGLKVDMELTEAPGEPAGLFGYVKNGVVACLNLAKPQVKGEYYTGAVVGYFEAAINEGDPRVEGCWVNGGTVSGEDYVGGLVGCQIGGYVDLNSVDNTTVTGTYYVGGLVGNTESNDYATTLYCNDVAGSTVTGDGNVGGLAGQVQGTPSHPVPVEGSGEFSKNLTVYGDDYGVGGLVGYMEYANLSCYYLSGMNVTGNDSVGGLVGYAGMSSISDCSIAGSGGSVAGNWNVGGLVGEMGGTLSGMPMMDGCHVTATGFKVTGGCAGGLVGYANNGSITGSYVNAKSFTVTGIENCAGGLFGQLYNAGASACFATGAGARVTGSGRVGGLVGLFEKNTLEDCYTTFGVKALWAVGERSVDAGGLVGYAGDNATIRYCYATGAVQAGPVPTGSQPPTLGGLVGNLNSVTLQHCYTTSTVEAKTMAGGLVGKAWSGAITNCYYRAESFAGEAMAGVDGTTLTDAVAVSQKEMLSTLGMEPGGAMAGLDPGLPHYVKRPGQDNTYYYPQLEVFHSQGYDDSGEDEDLATKNPVWIASMASAAHKAPTATKLTLNKKTLTLGLGGKATLTAKVEPANTYLKTVEWSIETIPLDGPVVAVRQDGTIIPLREGTATVVATTHESYSSGELVDAGPYEATCTVTVTAATGAVQPDFSWYDGKTGPDYTITTAAQLYALSLIVHDNASEAYKNEYFAGKTITLGKDINLAGPFANVDGANPTGTWLPIGSTDAGFAGTFKGNGKTITGLYIYRPSSGHYGEDVGLFGVLDGATVESLTLRGADVAGRGYAGALAGTLVNSAQITSCVVEDSTVAGTKQAGGLAGNIIGSGVEKCRVSGVAVTADTTATANAGGIAGMARNGSTIKASSFTGEVRATGDSPYAGGIVGDAQSTVIETSFAAGSVAYTGSSTTTTASLGGAVGYMLNSSLKACYANVAVRAAAGDTRRLGGLVGRADFSSDAPSVITQSYAIGSIEDAAGGGTLNAGGLVGYVSTTAAYLLSAEETLQDSFYDQEAYPGTDPVGGFDWNGSGSDAYTTVSGLPAKDMLAYETREKLGTHNYGAVAILETTLVYPQLTVHEGKNPDSLPSVWVGRRAASVITPPNVVSIGATLETTTLSGGRVLGAGQVITGTFKWTEPASTPVPKGTSWHPVVFKPASPRYRDATTQVAIRNTVPTGLKLEYASITLRVGDNRPINAIRQMSDDESPSGTVAWESSNPDVLRLLPAGTSTPLMASNPGVAVVTASWKGFTASCRVVVLPKEGAITFAQKQMYIAKGETALLNVTVTDGLGILLTSEEYIGTAPSNEPNITYDGVAKTVEVDATGADPCNFLLQLSSNDGSVFDICRVVITDNGTAALPEYRLETTKATLYTQCSRPTTLALVRDIAGNAADNDDGMLRTGTIEFVDTSTTNNPIAALNECFGISMLDGRTLGVTSKLTSDPETMQPKLNALAGSYKVKLKITPPSGSGAASKVLAKTLSLTINKKMPTVKAAAVTLNNFNSDAGAYVKLSDSSKITSMDYDVSTKAKATANAKAAKWMNFNFAPSFSVYMEDDEDTAKHSGTVYFLAMLADWGTGDPNESANWVTFSMKVSAKPTPPALKLSNSKVTLWGGAGQSSGAKLAVQPKKKGVSLDSLDYDYNVNVTPWASLSAKEKKTYKLNNPGVCTYGVTWNDADETDTAHAFRLYVKGGATPVAGKLLLDVWTDDCIKPMRLPVTVGVAKTTGRIALKAAKGTVSLSVHYLSAQDTAEVALSPSVKDYALNWGKVSYEILDAKGKKEVTDAPFTVAVDKGKVTFTALPGMASKVNGTWRVRLTAKGANAHLAKGSKDAVTTITVKTYPNSKMPTASLKAKGSVDLTTGAGTVVNLSYKNVSTGYVQPGLIIYAPDKQTDVTDDFIIDRLTTTSWSVMPKKGTSQLVKGTYVMQMSETAALSPATSATSHANLKVVASKPKMTQSAKAVTLYTNDPSDVAWVKLSLPAGCNAIREVELKGSDTSKFEADLLQPAASGWVKITFKGNVTTATTTKDVYLDVYLEGNKDAPVTAKVRVNVKTLS